ncbi:hypothetical protein PG990_008416 [Apiospora arundinis]|uniref:Uncharacterized protein n=1 Tax=Apiospora arundinis TaxID=335852 RepID=A0ABR2JNJ8_9PEZI
MSSQEIREQRELRRRLAKENRKAEAQLLEVRVPEKETVPWKKIEIHPGPFSPWLSNQITSFEELASRFDDAAFIALNTKCRKWRDPDNPAPEQYSQCKEVGWALLADLNQRENTSTETLDPSINGLVRQFDIQAKNTQVNEWYLESVGPQTEAFPYGTTDHVGLSDLDERMDKHIEYLKKQAKGRPLILVGFGIKNDLRHFWRDFPTGARHISGWVELQGLLRRSTQSHGPSMGLGTSLRALGYSFTETPDPMQGKAEARRTHIAAMESVRTLALLEAMASTDENVTSRLRLVERPNFPLLSLPREPWTYPSRLFQLKITNTRGRSEGLPPEIDSVSKLADFVYDRGNLAKSVSGWGRAARSTGSAYEPLWVCKGVRATRRQIGFLEFTDEEKMRRFAREASEWIFDGERLKVEVLFDPATKRKHKDEKTQDDGRKRKEREQKKQMPPAGILDLQNEELDNGVESLIPDWI